jgi:hypothetical protein
MFRPLSLPTAAALLGGLFAPAAPAGEPVKHAFLATGGETFIADESGRATWKYPHPSRDSWVLESGPVLLALSKSKTYPGGAVVQVARDGKVLVRTGEWVAYTSRPGKDERPGEFAAADGSERLLGTLRRGLADGDWSLGSDDSCFRWSKATV